MGLYALLIGTICSYLFRTTDVILYTHTHLVDSPIWTTVKNYAINFAAMAFVYCVFDIIMPLRTESAIEWIAQAIVVSILVFITFAALNFVFNKEKVVEIYSFIKHKINVKR